MGASLRIVFLVENRPVREGLAVEHGLSLWVEAGGFRLLFDFGQGDAFLRNASRLGVPLEKADALALSHGHYDHSGGLAFLKGGLEPGRLYLHPAALSCRYSCPIGSAARAIGMPEASARVVRRLGTRRTGTEAPLKVSERIGISGPIPRKAAFENVGGPFFLDPERAEPDAIPDDQAVWVETERGVVVLLGCAHAGVVNTLDYLSSILKVQRFRAVIGGMHLWQADETRLKETLRAFERYEVGLLAPCHCTGDEAEALFERAMPAAFLRVGCGSELEL
jgi:7,8-dihydropterin-6-yl-methyl-4-(beta-D-ribofuranosyl)aminobenzene 5'-phosphate synthase